MMTRRKYSCDVRFMVNIIDVSISVLMTSRYVAYVLSTLHLATIAKQRGTFWSFEDF